MRILTLRYDEKQFNKMKKDKNSSSLTWEEYIYYLFDYRMGFKND